MVSRDWDLFMVLLFVVEIVWRGIGIGFKDFIESCFRIKVGV